MRKIDYTRARWIFGLCFWMLSFSGFAGNYKVELLIFAHQNSSSELFDQTSSRIKWPNQLAEIEAPAVASQNSVTLMPVTSLISSASRLTEQKSFHLLLQTAWLQTINETQPGTPVHISLPDESLDGYVQLSIGTNINVHIDAEYAPFKLLKTPSKSASANTYFRINESRQVNPNEIHYFDHPKFGIIVLVSSLAP